MRNIRFTVYDAGIYPPLLRVRNGLVGISLEDRTGESVGLLIERKSGDELISIGQVSRLTNQSRGRNILNLAPGQYRISNLSRPTSEAELIVEPK